MKGAGSRRAGDENERRGLEEDRELCKNVQLRPTILILSGGNVDEGEKIVWRRNARRFQESPLEAREKGPVGNGLGIPKFEEFELGSKISYSPKLHDQTCSETRTVI